MLILYETLHYNIKGYNKSKLCGDRTHEQNKFGLMSGYANHCDIDAYVKLTAHSYNKY